jgi:hypothetical protein
MNISTGILTEKAFSKRTSKECHDARNGGHRDLLFTVDGALNVRHGEGSIDARLQNINEGKVQRVTPEGSFEDTSGGILQLLRWRSQLYM